MSDSCKHQNDSNDPSTPEVLAPILAAADGLLMPSESDYPFEPFRWPGVGSLTPESLATSLGMPPDAPVETRDFEAFFGRLSAVYDWHGEQERATAAQFAVLRDTIVEHLDDLVVYRVGSRQIKVVIAGRDATGAIGGLCTTVIET